MSFFPFKIGDCKLRLNYLTLIDNILNNYIKFINNIRLSHNGRSTTNKKDSSI